MAGNKKPGFITSTKCLGEELPGLLMLIYSLNHRGLKLT